MTDKANSSSEVSIAVLQEQVKTLSSIVEGLQKDRDSALRWGIATLGAAVLGLGTWAFNLVTQAIKVN
jgi:hypothetical protein